MLHILVSITQPIVESGYFSRFIWPSRGGRVIPWTQHGHLLCGQTLVHATDGRREIVRQLECEQMSRGCHPATVCLNFCSPFVLFLCPPSKLSLSSGMFLPSASFICLKLYDDEKSSIKFFWPLSLSLCGFLFLHLSVLFSLPHHTFFLSDFLDLFVPFSALHPLSLHLFLSLLSLSLCGRVVINPYFIAGEFLSPCRADSSPRSKTLLGPNPILPPSITPSLPPSGPDYWESGRMAGGWGEKMEGGITPLHPGRGKGTKRRWDDGNGWRTICWWGRDWSWRSGDEESKKM